MGTTIEVSKQTVKQLLETGKSKQFLIPEYQRPYSWTEEQVQTLFDDLVEYTASSNESTYFLGAIVSFENNNKQEIIDGQQRITTLFLLLRAIYKKLSSMSETPQSRNFMSQIESSLWDQDELTAEVDFNNALITSNVIGELENSNFLQILQSGDVLLDAKDRYSLNYSLLTRLVESYASREPELFYYFIRNVLNRAILLPITADNQETALMIFSTLNNRGLALSDADIFKAKIYSHLDARDKSRFIEQWQDIYEGAESSGETIQKLFYYYMFYLRASENDRSSTTPGIRKYYAQNQYEKLYHPELLNDLSCLVEFWSVVNKRQVIDNEVWTQNSAILKVLDILSSYPNEFWKYPVIIYYLKYKDIPNFEEKYLTFLRRLTAELLARYIITPTINAVKQRILNLNAEIYHSDTPKFEFAAVEENLRDYLKTPHRNVVRMLLKTLAYEKQEELLPFGWEIEHILPQKWQTSFFPENTAKEVERLVEHLGNKLPFEKKLNVIASNGYFKKKQESYNQSNIQIVRELSREKEKWDLEDIRERDLRLADAIITLLGSWGLNKKDHCPNFTVKISPDRYNDYTAFLDLFQKEDSDECRKQFLDLKETP